MPPLVLPSSFVSLSLSQDISLSRRTQYHIPSYSLFCLTGDSGVDVGTSGNSMASVFASSGSLLLGIFASANC
jgi:hypothetical protein